MSEPRNNWWGVLWPGLVLDEEAKHVRRLGMAVWLLLYLIVHANRRTGVVLSYRTTIARRMGVPLRTVQRWLFRLEREGYAALSSGARGPCIRVLRWRALMPRATSDATSASSGVRDATSGAKREAPTGEIAHSKAKNAGPAEARTKRYVRNGYY